MRKKSCEDLSFQPSLIYRVLNSATFNRILGYESYSTKYIKQFAGEVKESQLNTRMRGILQGSNLKQECIFYPTHFQYHSLIPYTTLSEYYMICATSPPPSLA